MNKTITTLTICATLFLSACFCKAAEPCECDGGTSEVSESDAPAPVDLPAEGTETGSGPSESDFR